MQYIENGKFVRLRETLESSSHGSWGVFESTFCYPSAPKFLALDIIVQLPQKQPGDSFTLRQDNVENQKSNSDLIFQVPLKNLTGIEHPTLGAVCSAQLGTRKFLGCITELNTKTVLIDCNYPFKGQKDFAVHVTIKEVRDPTEQEKTQGVIAKRVAI